MNQPPPLPPEILRRISDTKLPPPAPLFPRALAFFADALLAALLASLAIHLLVPVVVPEAFPIFSETMQALWNDYRTATEEAARGNTEFATAFFRSIPQRVQSEAVRETMSFITITATLVTLAYFVIAERITRGSSLGKKIFRLRVVSTLTGEPPRLIQTISRSLWRACSVAPVGILITIIVTINAHIPFFSYRRRAWHDKLAHTEVVDDKVA